MASPNGNSLGVEGTHLIFKDLVQEKGCKTSYYFFVLIIS